MGASSSKSSDGKLKPDNISTVSMALESGQPGPTKPSRSSRQQKPSSNGTYNLQPPPPSSSSSSTALSKGLNHLNANAASSSIRFNGENSTKNSRLGMIDFNGNHFYPASTNQHHSIGKGSTASSGHHKSGSDDSNKLNHDTNNNNTFKSSISVKVETDQRKTPLRNHSTASIPYELATSGVARGQSQLSLYSSVTGKSDEEKREKMGAKSGRKSGTTLIVFLLELASLAGLAVLAYFLRFTDQFDVVKRDYNCADQSVNLEKNGPTFKDSIVFGSLTSTEYYLILGLGPILVIFLLEISRSLIIYSLSHNTSSDTVHLKKLGIPLPLFIRRMTRIIAGFLFGILLTTVLVDLIKVQTGHLRPYFGKVCTNLTEFCEKTPGILNATLVEDKCTPEEIKDIREARLSFPSVSAAMAVFSATFLVFYISFALPYRALRWARLWTTLGLFAVVFFTINAGLATFQHHLEDSIVGGLIGLLFSLYTVFLHLNAFANRLSVSNPLSAKRAGEENVHNKSNIEGGKLSTLSDPFDENGSLSQSGGAGGLFGGADNDRDWFWKNFHIPRVRQSARNMWRRSENYFARGGAARSAGAANDVNSRGTSPRATSAGARGHSNAYINPAFNGGSGRNDEGHILSNHLHQETRFGGLSGTSNGGLASTANLHPGANHRASNALRTFQASSNA